MGNFIYFLFGNEHVKVVLKVGHRQGCSYLAEIPNFLCFTEQLEKFGVWRLGVADQLWWARKHFVSVTFANIFYCQSLQLVSPL